MALNDFHVSEPYTLGIELEMQVINPPGYDLSQDSSTLIDAVPIEGFDAEVLDAEFGLKEKGYTSLVVVPVGHHSVEDFNAGLPKSRLPLETTLTEV